MSLFDQSHLLISPRSPFARRVRIAFLEHGVDFKETPMNVFEPQPYLAKYNPLRRVPTLILRSGQEIVDSNSILQAFYDEKRNSPWMPFDQELKIMALNWSGIAVGVCEKTVEYYLETLKVPALQDQSVMSEARMLILDCFQKFENALNYKKYILGEGPYQVDIDWGTTLEYAVLRLPLIIQLQNLKDKYPQTLKYLMNLSERESFKKTIPPK